MNNKKEEREQFWVILKDLDRPKVSWVLIIKRSCMIFLGGIFNRVLNVEKTLQKVTEWVWAEKVEMIKTNILKDVTMRCVFQVGFPRKHSLRKSLSGISLGSVLGINTCAKKGEGSRSRRSGAVMQYWLHFQPNPGSSGAKMAHRRANVAGFL